MTENQLTQCVIGTAIEVHRNLGPGLLESVYKECLAHALTKAGLDVRTEVPIPVWYEGAKLSCGYRLDILVEGRLVVEIKSVDQINALHMAQVLTYLRLGDFRLGLLLNFNVVLLKDGCRRLINGSIQE